MNDPSSITLSYYDPRHGDTYAIILEDNEFAFALRYIDSVGKDPIMYSHLVDIPEPHRSAIEREIDRRMT